MGLLIAYNLIRLEMQCVADHAAVAPTRISFVAVYRMICDEWGPRSLPQAPSRVTSESFSSIERFILPDRRRVRAFPRAVKVKMSKYKKKRRPHPAQLENDRPTSN